jgi:hypothetical protein
MAMKKKAPASKAASAKMSASSNKPKPKEPPKPPAKTPAAPKTTMAKPPSPPARIVKGTPPPVGSRPTTGGRPSMTTAQVDARLSQMNKDMAGRSYFAARVVGGSAGNGGAGGGRGRLGGGLRGHGK